MVTTEEDPLKKVRPLHDHVKETAREYYQPLHELSVDERMVKYLPKKPNTWGFKYWVVADITGYSTDIELYRGSHRGTAISENGLTYDTINYYEPCQTLYISGILQVIYNFYTSPCLLKSLKELGIRATGTLGSNRKDIPESVLRLKQAIGRSDVPQETSYYFRKEDDVYVCWRDKRHVLVMSNNYPGCSDGTAKRHEQNIGVMSHIS